MMSTDRHYFRCIMPPGYVVVSNEPTLLCTVCGNGIAVVLWDRLKRIGGMAHCVLPESRGKEALSNLHADMAIYSLIKQMIDYTNISDAWEAQLFGGGHCQGLHKNRAEEILKIVKRILKRFAIEIVSEDTGGSLGRKIVFNTFSGDVILRKTKRVRKSDWTPECA